MSGRRNGCGEKEGESPPYKGGYKGGPADV